MRTWMALSILLVAAPAAAQTTLARHVLGGAGGRSASAGTALGLTVGQAVTGTTSGVSTARLGFWPRGGVAVVVGIGDEPGPGPLRTRLGQNHPNPFNPSTTIAFSLAHEGFVELAVFDARGRLVARPVAESRPAGRYELVLRPGDWASGIYFYRLRADGHVATRRMVLVQ